MNDQVCDGFMTVMAERMPWKSGEEDCEFSIKQIGSRLTVLSVLMGHMISTNLTVFTTFKNMTACGLKMPLPHVNFEYVDATRLLLEYGYGNALTNMRKWNVTGYTRTSDVLRILLAHKFQKTYIDTDIHFLNLDVAHYKQPFASAAIWQHHENSIEISNSAFCLPRNILNDMMAFQRQRIEKDPYNFFYTELGPSMFHRVLLNKHSVQLYSQNHPTEFNFTKIAMSILLNQHKFLHLTGSIRKKFKTGYEFLVSKIRRVANYTVFT